MQLKIRDSFDDLYARFSKSSHFDWIAKRVKRMEATWRGAAQRLAAKPYYKKWKQKKVTFFYFAGEIVLRLLLSVVNRVTVVIVTQQDPV